MTDRNTQIPSNENNTNSPKDNVINLWERKKIKPEDLIQAMVTDKPQEEGSILQLALISKYYQDTLIRSQQTFYIAVSFGLLGLLGFISTLIFFFILAKVDIAFISAIASSIMEIIAIMNYLIYGKIILQLNDYQLSLRQLQTFLLADSFSEKITELQLRDRTRSAIIKSFVQKPNAELEKLPRKNKGTGRAKTNPKKSDEANNALDSKNNNFSDKVNDLTSTASPSISNKSKSNFLDSTNFSNMQITIMEEPLTAPNLANFITTLTELYTKCWLIVQKRNTDLIEYTQTRNPRYSEEANIIIEKLSHNSPLELHLKEMPIGVAEALGIAVESLALMPTKVKAEMLKNKTAEIDNELKSLEGMSKLADEEQSRNIASQKAALENRKVLLELYVQWLEAGREEQRSALELQIAAQDGLIENQRKQFQLDLDKQKAKIELKATANKADIDQQLAALKAQVEAEKAFLELEKEKLKLDRDKLEVQELQLGLMKKSYEYAMETAQKMIDVLNPGADPTTRMLLASTLLPQLLQLNNVKGLKLLPPAQEVKDLNIKTEEQAG